MIPKEEIYIFRARKRTGLVPVFWNGVSQTMEQTRKLHGAAPRKQWQVFDSNQKLTIFVLKTEWEKTSNLIAAKILGEKNFLKNLFLKQKGVGLKAELFVKNNHKSKNLKLLSINKLLSLYEKIYRMWLLFDHTNVSSWLYGADLVQENIKKELQRKGLNSDETETLFTCPQMSFSAEEELELFLLALSYKQGLKRDILIKKIKRLSSKYYWIPFGYDGPNLNDDIHYFQIIKILSRKDKEEIIKKIKYLKNFSSEIKAKQLRIFKKFSLGKEIKRNIEFLHILSMMTDYRKQVTFKLHVFLHEVIQYLSLKLQIEKSDLMMIFYEELKNNIARKDLLEQIAYQRKKRNFFVYIVNGIPTVYHDRALFMDIKRKVDKETKSTDTVIRGVVASRGNLSIVTAKVFVASTPVDARKIKRGDILVTFMTTPEFVPAMRKASAIITDEGGVTSHAAIISRELKIPCIIGTKIATKVLKDGDEVEADADKGIIKILRHSPNNLV